MDQKIVYFAHVPKCGGTTVEVALREAGFELCFVSGGWRALGNDAWIRSSPQHITSDHLTRLFGNDFFDYSFAVVRHPVHRFISAVNHNRQNGNIRWNVSIERMIAKLEKSRNYLLHSCDNHFVPAVELIPPRARVFKLEDGMEAVFHGLFEDLGSSLGVLRFGAHNQRNYNEVRYSSVVKKLIKKRFQPVIPKPNELSKPLRARILDLYRDDLNAFGYPDDIPAP